MHNDLTDIFTLQFSDPKSNKHGFKEQNIMYL